MTDNSRNARTRVVIGRGEQSGAEYRGRLRRLQVRYRKGADPLHAQHVEPFGFTGFAPNGSSVVTAAIGGNRSMSLVLFAFNEEYKLEINEGEAALYNQWGDFVCITKDRTIHAAAANKVFADTPLLECTGDCKIGGKLDVAGKIKSDDDVIADTVSLKTHKTTGVTPGPGLSGDPV